MLLTKHLLSNGQSMLVVRQGLVELALLFQQTSKVVEAGSNITMLLTKYLLLNRQSLLVVDQGLVKLALLNDHTSDVAETASNIRLAEDSNIRLAGELPRPNLPRLKGFKTVSILIFRKLFDKRTKNLPQTSLKLFPSNRKMQINQSGW